MSNHTVSEGVTPIYSLSHQARMRYCHAAQGRSKEDPAPMSNGLLVRLACYLTLRKTRLVVPITPRLCVRMESRS